MKILLENDVERGRAILEVMEIPEYASDAVGELLTQFTEFLENYIQAKEARNLDGPAASSEACVVELEKSLLRMHVSLFTAVTASRAAASLISSAEFLDGTLSLVDDE